MRFDRLLPDDQLAEGEAPFSADNENAKTEALEGLFNNAAPNAIADGRGFQVRNKPKISESILFMLTSYEGYGGGRYEGRRILTRQLGTKLQKDVDLDETFLQNASFAPDLEVWYTPEIGTSEHNLPVDPLDIKIAQIGAGIVVGYNGPNNLVVVMTSSPGLVIKWGMISAPFDYSGQVSLYPVKGPTDDTRLQDENGDDLPAVNVFVNYPTTNTIYAPGLVNQILAYIKIASDVDGDPIYKLFDPPSDPPSRSQFMVKQLMDESGVMVDWDFTKGH